ncbi:MAG: phosphodiester glycosidase family protein [Eubacteriales bacterium]|nr:phosphodiester glycosidase family protein [Eubacteriales bacterium]
MEEKRESRSALRGAGGVMVKILAVILTTVLLITAGLCGVVWILSRGPSPTAQKLFVLSVRETSAVGFLADMFLSEEEVAAIAAEAEDTGSDEQTDTSMIQVNKPSDSETVENPENPDPEEEQPEQPEIPTSDLPEDTDGDGIEIVDVSGKGFRGKMMFVFDPTRVFVGTPPTLGGVGQTLMDMVETYEAVGGINGGGFYDPNGTGSGGIPDGILISNGELLYGSAGVSYSTVGFDAEGVLHVGNMTPQQAVDAGLQHAVSFGPALIINGVIQDEGGALVSGVNPRTAIGQRADGVALLLVIDGRQIGCLGATYEDLAQVMLEFGAVNASNLDGGSSTLMVYEGEIQNVCASVSGPRPIPTAFLVK